MISSILSFSPLKNKYINIKFKIPNTDSNHTEEEYVPILSCGISVDLLIKGLVAAGFASIPGLFKCLKF